MFWVLPHQVGVSDALKTLKVQASYFLFHSVWLFVRQSTHTCILL